MSAKDVKEFFAKIAKDKELAEKVKAAGTNVEKIISLGKENGLEFTAEDLKAVHDETKDRVGEGLQTFLEKVSKDEELARKLEAAGTDVDEIIRLGRENGCEFTVDNLMALQNLTMKSGAELSDEELEKVAGGFAAALVGLVASVGAVVFGTVALVGAGAVGYIAGKGGK